MYGPRPAWRERDEVVVERPNRRKAASRVATALVVVLLLVSAELIIAVTVGGWESRR